MHVETNNNRDALLSKWRQTDYLYKLKQDCLCGEAGHAISELCAGRATRNVYVETNNDKDALLSNWGQTVYLLKKMKKITYHTVEKIIKVDTEVAKCCWYSCKRKEYCESSDI